MANGTEKTDWTVEVTSPYGGVVYYGTYRARFTVSTGGKVQITWPATEPTAGDRQQMQRAAYDAVADVAKTL